MINRTAFTAYNFQRVWAVFSNVFQVFSRKAADVFYVVVFAAWAVEDYVTFHCDKRIKLSEKAQNNIF